MSLITLTTVQGIKSPPPRTIQWRAYLIYLQYRKTSAGQNTHRKSQDLNYEFDNVGNILEVEDNILNSVRIYGYDDLDRLTSVDMSVNSVPI
jgi:hypothetical protein